MGLTDPMDVVSATEWRSNGGHGEFEKVTEMEDDGAKATRRKIEVVVKAEVNVTPENIWGDKRVFLEK